MLITLLLYGLRYLHYQGLLRQQNGYYAKYSSCFLRHNSFDVLFLGSSRAEMHYDTGLFDSLTGKNSFNLSLAGATPPVAYAALCAYLQNSAAPSYLIYETDYHNLNEKGDRIKEFNNYFPFLGNKTLLRKFSAIDHRMPNFYYNPYFSFPYTGLKNISTSLHGWLNIPNRTDALYHKGFFKEVLRPALDFTPTKAFYAYIHPDNRNYLDSIILLCRQKNIRLSLVSSPVFGGGRIEISNKDRLSAQLRRIALIHGIRYFDLSSLPFCNKRGLFVDHYHLNYAGAAKFTRVLSQVFNNKMVNNSLK